MGGLIDSFVVMSNELRDAYVRALQTTEGSDPLSQLARASLQASAMKFSELGLQEAATGPGLDFRLSDTSHGGLISANGVGDFLQRVQRAVARLDVAASVPRSVIVDLRPRAQSDGEERGELPPSGVSWAEIDAVELVRALPEGPNDEESMDSLFSTSPVVRRAVADLILFRNPSRCGDPWIRGRIPGQHRQSES